MLCDRTDDVRARLLLPSALSSFHIPNSPIFFRHFCILCDSKLLRIRKEGCEAKSFSARIGHNRNPKSLISVSKPKPRTPKLHLLVFVEND